MAAGLVTVNGCSDLRATLGTLEQVNGSTLVLRSQFDGHLVTVTTSASTKITQVETGSLSEITDGAHVLVSGTSSGRGIAAQRIAVGRTGRWQRTRSNKGSCRPATQARGSGSR